MFDLMLDIAEAVLEELKKKQQNNPLAVAVIIANTNLQNKKIFINLGIIFNKNNLQETTIMMDAITTTITIVINW